MNTKDSPSASEIESDVTRELDRKLVELQSLFETSRVLNSSLNLHTILNNVLLTPMGRMMISKGLVMLASEGKGFTVEIIKGMPRNLVGKNLNFEIRIDEPTLVEEIDSTESPWTSFFKQFGVELLIPIESNNKKLGLVGFGAKISRTSFTNNELEFLNSLSNIAATSIENGLMFHELETVNRRLDKKIQELNTLFDYGKELNSTLDVNKILNLLSFAVMGELMVSRCLVFLKDNDRMDIKICKGAKLNKKESESLAGERFLKSLCNVQEPLLVDEADLPTSLNCLAVNDIKVVAPMKIQDETKGVLAVGEKISKQEFMADELEFLYTLGNQAMISLENARLFEEALEKQRMEEELNIAREIQQGLLPKSCPQPQGFEIYGINVPSRQVGGDYYDCIQFDENHFGICIADVSGKGAPASLLMANLQASLHALSSADYNIAEMTSKINNLVYQNTGLDKFITYFYGILDSTEKTFTYINAGHNPPYLCHADGSIETLEKGGLLLGMMPNMPYEMETRELQSGDIILMFTDGISEAMNPEEEEFEEHRIEAVLRKEINSTAQNVVEQITHAVKEFVRNAPQSDDITMVCLKMV